jgi:hypothetical protein
MSSGTAHQSSSFAPSFNVSKSIENSNPNGSEGSVVLLTSESPSILEQFSSENVTTESCQIWQRSGTAVGFSANSGGNNNINIPSLSHGKGVRDSFSKSLRNESEICVFASVRRPGFAQILINIRLSKMANEFSTNNLSNLHDNPVLLIVFANSCESIDENLCINQMPLNQFPKMNIE